MNNRLLALGFASVGGLIIGAISAISPGRDSAALSAGSMPQHSAAESSRSVSLTESSDSALGTALSALGAEADLRQLARLGEALEQLDAVQMAKLVDSSREDSAARSDRLAWLFIWWRKRDAISATAWIHRHLELVAQDGPQGWHTLLGSGCDKLYEAWTAADPRGALEFARLHPQSGIAGYLLDQAMKAWPDQSADQQLALLQDFPPGKTRADALARVLAKWAAREPVAAFAAAKALVDDGERRKATTSVLQRWGEKQPEAAFAEYLAMGLSDSGLLDGLLQSAAEKNPAQAVNLLTQLDPMQFAGAAPVVVAKWVEKDPAAALTWALENGVGLFSIGEMKNEVIHDSLGRATTSSFGSVGDPLASALNQKTDATIAWLNTLPAGSKREQLLEYATGALRDVDKALELFSQLSPEAAARVAQGVAAKFEKAPERGQQWAASLPPGPVREGAWRGLGQALGETVSPPTEADRDAMLSGMVFGFGWRESPIPSLETAMRISDPQLRHDMLDEAVEDFTKRNFAGWGDRAVEWLEKTNLPEQWKQRWRSLRAR